MPALPIDGDLPETLGSRPPDELLDLYLAAFEEPSGEGEIVIDQDEGPGA